MLQKRNSKWESQVESFITKVSCLLWHRNRKIITPCEQGGEKCLPKDKTYTSSGQQTDPGVSLGYSIELGEGAWRTYLLLILIQAS